MYYGVARSNGVNFVAYGGTYEETLNKLKQMTDTVELAVIAKVEKEEDVSIITTGLVVPEP